jgi:hypothetical protein
MLKNTNLENSLLTNYVWILRIDILTNEKNGFYQYKDRS